MTPQQLTMHPAWAMFQRRLPMVLNALVQNGQIPPQEAGVIRQMMQQVGPNTQNFVNGLTMRYNNIDENGMDAELIQNFIPMIRQAAQQQMMRMGGGMGMGMPMNSGMPMNYGGYQAPMQPTGFGFGPGFTRSNPGYMQQQQRDPFAAPGGVTNAGMNLFGTPGVTPPPVQKKDDPAPKKMNWAPPAILDSKTGTVCGCVQIKTARYQFGDDHITRRAVVLDPRIRYANDWEAINAFKGVFPSDRPNEHKFLTVSYKQLKVVRADRADFLKLAQAVSAEVQKNQQTLEAKLRAITNTLTRFSVGCVEAFTKLFLEEVDAHILSGELVDSVHPKNLLSFNDMNGILDIVTGEADKGMLDVLKSMSGFTERFEKLIARIVDDLVVRMPRLILDPVKDETCLDDYSRVLPQVWSLDGGTTMNGVDDYFELYLMSRQTIDGSRSDSAVASGSKLQTRLDEIHKQFCLIYVPRVVSWCDYPMTSVVQFADNGDCVPSVNACDKPTNDIQFFCSEVLTGCNDSRAVLLKWSPKTIICESAEETFTMQYGFTTDMHCWICSAKYWS